MLLPNIGPAPSVSLDSAVTVVEAQCNNLINMQTGDADARLAAYHRWAVPAVEALRMVVGYEGAAVLVETSGFGWLMQRTGAARNARLVNEMVSSEQAD